MVGLDGLRAVAVIAVVLYHADVPGVSGGFLGVDVFFVLSGFLITSLLLVELDRTGRISFRRFYARRARRLLPALIAVLVVTAVLVATLAYDSAGGFRRDLPGALLYFSNWSNIFTQTSYFEFIGRPPMLKHLWSLAVEEQFYIFWPAIALFAYRWRGARAVGLVAVGGAVLSTLAMLIGSIVGDMPGATDPSRLYFGTDTHAMGVLVGAALAVVWRPGRTSPVLPRQAQAVITAAGAVALGLLVLAFMSVGEYSTFLYRGGFLLIAVVSAVVVAAASHRGVPFGSWLGNRPMRWIGERSYGIYLWHWPLFLVTRPGADVPVDGVLALVLRIGLLLVVAEASYRFLEMPIRNGALSRAWQRVREGDLGRPSPVVVAAAVATTLVLAFTGVRVWTAPSPAAAGGLTDAQLAALAPARAPLEVDFLRIRVAEGKDPRPKLTAFGDSVLLGSSRTLEGVFNIDLHAHVAEQATDLQQRIESQVRAGDVRDLVLLHVGNNGIVTEQQLRGMLDQLSGVPRVVVATVQVPRSWMGPNNALIARVAGDYPNVVVADWAETSADHREYMVSDGVHLTGKGAREYTRIIAEAAGVETEQ
jgi:peptidoglycan/LPS O-acetylase OafA/YrhL